MLILKSELYIYCGCEKCDLGFIMGYEFVGIVVEVGVLVILVKVGDKVVILFIVLW